MEMRALVSALEFGREVLTAENFASLDFGGAIMSTSDGMLLLDIRSDRDIVVQAQTYPKQKTRVVIWSDGIEYDTGLFRSTYRKGGIAHE